jgi:hypothetical protein
LQKNVEFAARIAELGKKAAQGAVMTAQQVLEELTKLACANMQDFVGDDDVTLSIASLDQNRAAAIQEYTVEHYVEGHGEEAKPVKKIKLKLADKLRALELLGKHYALFTERHVHELGGVAERLAAALARADERANDNVRPPPRGAARGEGSTHERAEEMGTSARIRKRRERRRARP